MSITATSGEIVEISVAFAPTGLAGQLGYQVDDTPDGTPLIPRTTAGVTEAPTGSGSYHAEITAPAQSGGYAVTWSYPDPDDAGQLVFSEPEQLTTTAGALSVVTLREQYLDWERTSDDPWLARVLEAALLYAEQVTGLKLEMLGTAEQPVTLDARVLSGGLIALPQVQDVVAVTVGGVPVLEWEIIGARGSFLRIATAGHVRPLRAQVTGRFGLVPLPADLEDAIYLLAARRAQEREGGYSDEMDVGDGDEQVRFGPLPPQVMTTFRSYRTGRPVTL